MTKLNDARLCYVKGSFAWFTTHDPEQQTGDDWDDAPYEHNAEPPYEPCWHNEPEVRNDPNRRRGLDPETGEPWVTGEMCRCVSCVRDWNDDGTPKWEISKVAWDGPLDPPGAFTINSGYSVDTINAGAIAWLFSAGLPQPVAIHAWVTVAEFTALVRKAGGNVYTPAP